MSVKRISRFIILAISFLFAGVIFSACEDKEVTLKSIKIVDSSYQAEYYQFDEYDLQHIMVEATYSDGSTQIFSGEDVKVSDFDTNTTGDKVVTVEYKGKTVQITITVKKFVQSVEIKAGSVATTVTHNSTLDTSNLVLVETYSDGTTNEVTEGLDILGIDTSTCGTQTLYVNYGGKTAQLDIEVVKYLASVSIKESSVPSAVKQNNALDTSNLVFIETYSDGSTEEITTGVEIGAFDTSVLGAQELSATYNGRTAKISINVYDYITTVSVKGTLQNEYLQYHDQSFEDLIIVAHHSNGDTSEFRYADRETATNGVVTAYQDNEISFWIDTAEGGSHNLKFALVLDSETYTTANYPITIHTLKTITIDPTTVQTTLYQNSDSYVNGLYNLDDAVAVLTYDNDTTERVKFVGIEDNSVKYNIAPYTSEDSSGYSINTFIPGTTHFTIKYNYLQNNSVVAVSAEEECTLDITVVPETSIEIDETRTPNYVLKYQEYDESKIKVIAHYQDNHSEETTYYTVWYYNGNLIVKTPDYSLQDSIALETIEVDHIDVKDSNNNIIQGYQFTIPDFQNKEYEVIVTYENNETVTYNEEVKPGSAMWFVFQDENSYGSAEIPGKVRVDRPYGLNIFGYATYNNHALEDVEFLINGVETKKFVKDEEINYGDISFVAVWDDETELTFTYDSNSGTYKNGDNSINITGGDINTSTVGVHTTTISITFNGFALNKEYEYEVSKDEYSISGYKYQSSIDIWNDRTNKQNTYTTEGSTGKKGFQTIENTYLVGSGNAFVYAPVMTVQYDDMSLDDEEITDFAKDITLWKLNEISNEFDLIDEDDIEDYVEISGVSYRFKTLAENATFKLKVVPANMSRFDQEIVEASDCTTFTFKVVAGYNVYTAADLSVFDNTNATIESDYSSYINVNIPVNKSNYDESGKWTQLKQNNGISLTNSATTLILHSNIRITENDIPSIHYYTHENGNTYLIDSLRDGFNYVYTRTLKPNETFTIEGNHYSISVKDLPIMIRENGESEDNPLDTPIVAHTTLFKVQGDEYNQANAESQNFVMRNLELEGNSAASEDERNWGGIISIKIDTVNSLVENVYSHEWYISLLWEGDEKEANNLTSVVKDTNCYNANNSLLFVWATRSLSLENCNMIKCGGPVMIVDYKNDTDANGEGECPSNVHVKNCVLQSYVTGNESWFKSFGDGAATLVATIKGLNGLYNNAVLDGSTKSFIDSHGRMNLIALYKSGDAEGLPTTPETYSGTFVDDTVVDLENNEKVRKYGPVDGDGNPVIVSPNPAYFPNGVAVGGMDLSKTNSAFSYLTTTNGALGIPGESGWAMAPDVNTLNASQDYLFIYHQLGIVLILGWM